MKLVTAITVGVLCVGMTALTFDVSGNPLYAALMGGLVILFGWFAIRASST